jgi:hypothetical protein
MLGNSPNCCGRGLLSTVYHGEAGVRTLRKLARRYLTIRKDLTRVMNRLKALYRSWGIFYGGKQVYARRHRSQWLGKIAEAGVRHRAELSYDQLDTLQSLVRKTMWRLHPGDQKGPTESRPRGSEFEAAGSQVLSARRGDPQTSGSHGE